MVSMRSALPCVVVLVVVVVVMASVGVTGSIQRKISSDTCTNITQLSTIKRNNCNGVSLMVAASKGDVRRIKEILTEPNQAYLLAYTENQGRRKGFTALFWAAEKNHSEAVEELVLAGADVNHTSPALYTVVYLLAENGALRPLKLVLGENAVPDVMTRKGHTPLIMAAWNGYAEVVQALLEKNANPNSTTPRTLYSPLYLAAKAGNVEVVKALLKGGADPNDQTSWGVTPLLAAAQWERGAVVPLLLQAGADPNLKEKDGYTALHKAVYYRHAQMVKALLDSAADPNVQDNFGRTPLHYSVVTKRNERMTKAMGQEARRRLEQLETIRLEVLRDLLSRCPDPAVKDKTGKTPMDVARMGNSVQVQQVLQGYNRASC